jgi:hypothetical protein
MSALSKANKRKSDRISSEVSTSASSFSSSSKAVRMDEDDSATITSRSSSQEGDHATVHLPTSRTIEEFLDAPTKFAPGPDIIDATYLEVRTWLSEPFVPFTFFFVRMLPAYGKGAKHGKTFLYM